MRNALTRCLAFLRGHPLGRFALFGFVGVLGFVVHSGWLIVAEQLMRSPLLSWWGGFFPAVLFTYLCNRNLTFQAPGPPHWREALRFLLANGVGALVNYATYSGLYLLFNAHPLLALPFGAIAGLVVNFVVNQFWVFQRPRP